MILFVVSIVVSLSSSMEIKVADQACFNAANVQSITFSPPQDGTITGIRLTNPTGDGVTCNTAQAAKNHWGCFDEYFGVSLINTDLKIAYYPTTSESTDGVTVSTACQTDECAANLMMLYFLDDAAPTSDEIILNGPEYEVKTTDSFELVYGEACCPAANSHHDNSGTTCADVYFDYAPVCTFLAIDQYLTLCSEEFPNTNDLVDSNAASISTLNQKVDTNAAAAITARGSLKTYLEGEISNVQGAVNDNAAADADAKSNLQSQIDDINVHLNALLNVPMSAQSIYSVNNNDDNLFGVNNSNQSLIILSLLTFNVLLITIICVLCYAQNQNNNGNKRIHFIDSDAEQQTLKS